MQNLGARGQFQNATPSRCGADSTDGTQSSNSPRDLCHLRNALPVGAGGRACGRPVRTLNSESVVRLDPTLGVLGAGL